MLKRFASYSIGLAVATMPPVAVLVAFISSLLHRHISPNWRAWLLIAMPLGALGCRYLLIDQVAVGSTLILQAALIWLAGAVLIGDRRVVTYGLLAALFIMFGTSMSLRLLSANAWNPIRARSVVEVITDFAYVKGAFPGAAATRTWDTAGITPSNIRLRFEARLAPPYERYIEGEDNSSRTWHESFPFSPGADETSVTRRFVLHPRFPDARYRIVLEVRSARGDLDCGRADLWQLPSARVEFDVCVDNEWRQFLLPFNGHGGPVDVDISGFLFPLEVKSWRLERYLPDRTRWVRQYDVASTAIVVRLHDGRPWTDDNLLGLTTAELAPTWTEYAVDGSWPTPEGGRQIDASMFVDWGTDVEVRDVSLVALNSDALAPTHLFVYDRVSLWFGHANLAGHSIAMSTIAVIATTMSPAIAVIGVIVGIAGIALTGSTGALFGLLLALTSLAIARHGRRGAKVSVCALVIVGAIALALVSLEISPIANSLLHEQRAFYTRLEIYRQAMTAILADPIRGWGTTGGSFSEIWQMSGNANRLGDALHAHNLWLEFAGDYGIFGLMAAVLTSAGLVLLSWRAGGPRGIAVVLPILAMQVFDNTLFFASVLLPMILAINILGQPKPEPA